MKKNPPPPRERPGQKKLSKFPNCSIFPGAPDAGPPAFCLPWRGWFWRSGFFGLAGMIGNWFAAGLRGALGGAAFLLPVIRFCRRGRLRNFPAGEICRIAVAGLALVSGRRGRLFGKP